ncbi:MAG: QueT transporter family protein [Bacilli bacterium]|jgi:uncharacterized membrane protein|nr:QueT transporter family protein [Bacilli bacterium]MCH4202508.1 QueT transporter family protein [Bacilli bacterium]MCH4235813.1 QueT transporter family protein [Bacilli bacterium]
MSKMTIRDFTDNAMIAAAYAVVTIVTSGFSYLGIQFRIAEILVLLCFFNPKYVIGVSLGCLISNYFSPMQIPDMIFGTGATIVSSLLVVYSKRLWIASIFPVLINAPVVGLELYYVLGLPFWLSAGQVAIGEATVMVIGLLIFYPLSQNQYFHRLLRSRRINK